MIAAALLVLRATLTVEPAQSGAPLAWTATIENAGAESFEMQPHFVVSTAESGQLRCLAPQNANAAGKITLAPGKKWTRRYTCAKWSAGYTLVGRLEPGEWSLQLFPEVVPYTVEAQGTSAKFSVEGEKRDLVPPEALPKKAKLGAAALGVTRALLHTVAIMQGIPNPGPPPRRTVVSVTFEIDNSAGKSAIDVVEVHAWVRSAKGERHALAWPIIAPARDGVVTIWPGDVPAKKKTPVLVTIADSGTPPALTLGETYEYVLRVADAKGNVAWLASEPIVFEAKPAPQNSLAPSVPR